MLSVQPIQVSMRDTELQRRTVCSLYVPTSVDPLQAPAERTFRWAVQERYAGRIAQPEALRARFMDEWTKELDDSSEFWLGPKRSAGFARRVYFFLLKYRILRPFRPYTLQLDRGDVTGENAIALWDKYRSEPVPMVIDALLRRPRATLIPNSAVLAQWLAARQEIDTLDVGIVHIPLISGESWTTKNVTETLARSWMNAIVNQAADAADFPRVGTQCGTCTKPCSRVFRGPDGPDWDWP